MSARPGRSLAWLLIILLGLAAAVWYREQPRISGLGQTSQLTGASLEENHYSPFENLERIDADRIGNAQRTLDIAMYAFTDKYLADTVLNAARRGVQVRIYRDHQQFQDEERKSGEHNDVSTSGMFAGQSNIQIRVKKNHELMHLKAYAIDGRMLRDGSANWSPSGLKRQDNNARFTTDPAQVKAFEQVFEEIWDRDNEVVQ
jgi:phosphatidylserine/phosphatidylglycerophosphate/cardiolipin synthase-like enzyme